MPNVSKYTPEVVDAICAGIAEGNGVREICKSADLPSAATVFNWLKDPDKAEFHQLYQQAQALRGDKLFNEVINIARDIPKNADRDEIARAKVQIDVLRWAAGKLAPAQYGDVTQMQVKQEIGLSGDMKRLLREIDGSSRGKLPGKSPAEEDAIEIEHTEVPKHEPDEPTDPPNPAA